MEQAHTINAIDIQKSDLSMSDIQSILKDKKKVTIQHPPQKKRYEFC
jgi:hypothetical protein